MLFFISCKKIEYYTFPWEKNSTEHIVNDSLWYTVKWVSDGDTFWVDNGTEKGLKIRLIGIDAPESVDYGEKLKQNFGEESHAFLNQLIKGKKVKLSYDLERYDKFGRTLAYAHLPDGTFVNKEILANGFAVKFNYAPNITYAEVFMKAEDSARINKLGIWGLD